MEIDQLKCYLKVAETLNFTKAADELFISQATLSRKINSLEEELGIPLFDRTTRTVHLSEAGRQCFSDTEKIVQLYENMVMKTLGLSGHTAGSLRIGYFRTDTAEYLARIVLRMREEYPAINVEYCKDELERLVKGLDDGSLDAVILFSPCIGEDDRYKRIPVAHEYPSVIVHKGHPLAEKKIVQYSDLTNEKIYINYGQNIPDHISGAVSELLRAQGILSDQPDPADRPDKLLLQVRLGECIIIDPFATASSGLPEAFVRLHLPSDNAFFNRDFIINKDNSNSLTPYLVQTVEKMVRERAFDNPETKN